MRLLSTCIFILIACALVAVVRAEQNTDIHPVLGKTPPRETLNKHLLELPERERQAWIHGAMAQMAQVISGKDAVTARCVMDWYFEVGNGAEIIPQAMKKYPDAPTTATIQTLARRFCPDA